ncbi:MAG: hypothetical protein ACLTT1_09935 [[Clostridium] scindens]
MQESVDQNQREYILREAAEARSGRSWGGRTPSPDAEEFQAGSRWLKAPKEVKEKLAKEINRFKSTHEQPGREVGVIRTYIETMLEMPWDKVCRGSQGYRLCQEGAGRGSLTAWSR